MPQEAWTLLTGKCKDHRSIRRSRVDALLHPWRRVTKRNPAFPFTQPFGTTGLLTKSHGLPRAVNEQGDSSPPTTFSPWTSSTQWTFLTFQNWAQMSHCQKGLLSWLSNLTQTLRSSVLLLVFLFWQQYLLVLFCLLYQNIRQSTGTNKASISFSFTAISSLLSTCYTGSWEVTKDRRLTLMSTTELLPC